MRLRVIQQASIAQYMIHWIGLCPDNFHGSLLLFLCQMRFKATNQGVLVRLHYYLECLGNFSQFECESPTIYTRSAYYLIFSFPYFFRVSKISAIHNLLNKNDIKILDQKSTWQGYLDLMDNRNHCHPTAFLGSLLSALLYASKSEMDIPPGTLGPYLARIPQICLAR